MINVIVISILIIPWLILPFNHLPDPTRLIKGAFFDLTMMGIIVMAIKNGLKFEYKNKYLSFLVAWVFTTFIFNWYYPLDSGIGYNISTIDYMIHFILSVMGVILICSNLEKLDFIRCAKAICVSATLVSVFCIFQGIGLDPMKHIAKYGWKEPRHIAALLDHPDIVGNYLCMCFPFFIYFNKPKYYVCLSLCVIALFLSHSSLSIVASAVGIFIYLIFRFSKTKSVLIGLLAFQLLFVVFCATNSGFNKFSGGFTGRISAWKMIIDKVNNPLFGQGLGAVRSFNVYTGTTKYPDIWSFAHNDYLETFCSTGALGLFLLILLIIHTLRNFNYKEDNQIGFSYYGSFVAFLLIMFGSFPMEMPPIALNGLIVFCAMQKT